MARPSTAFINQRLDELEARVAAHPDGITRAGLAAELAARPGGAAHPRTLQRRLARLAREGRIVVHGRGNAVVYRPVADAPPRGPASPTLPPTVAAPAETRAGRSGVEDVPLSPEGAEVRALVRRPITQRDPVGYRREFLEDYEPGKTWYLPHAARERLHEMGRTPDPDRPAGTYARGIMERLLVDLAWASSRLEGNTYSRLDTQNLIEFGQQAQGTDAHEAQMILNHKHAVELLVDEADVVGFNRATILGLHAALSENLMGDHRDEGRLRVRMVHITGTPYLPTAIPQLIEEHLDLLLAKVSAIPDPFEQAFFAMVHIPYLQPFADVNKRTSRLAANIPLVVNNLCPLSFVDVPERAYVDGTLGVYEENRVELLRDLFVWAYERSCKQYLVVRDAMGEPDPLRLRYRNELAEVVRKTVIAVVPPRYELLRGWGEQRGVAPEDLDGFAERALSLVVNLNEGTARRYRLRPSEFQEWWDQYATKARRGQYTAARD